MAKFGIRVQKGKIAESKEEALKVARELVEEKAAELVVKSQIHAGGRGKGTFNTGFKGGVKVTVGANR
jgi:succinyl-CoA synthetase beta subunit